MDDWEAAYEEDRRRLALGQDLSSNNYHGGSATTTTERDFAEKRDLVQPTATAAAAAAVLSQAPPMGGLSPAMFHSTHPPPPPPPPSSSSLSWALPSERHETEKTDACRREQHNAADDLGDVYAEYRDDSLPPRRVLLDDGAGGHDDQESMQDTRFDLPYVPPGWNLSSVFGAKMGRRLFFAEVITTSFKGFLSGKETSVGCFVTPNCLYIGDVKTGALVICVDIQRLHEVYVFDNLSLGLRTMNAFDLHLQTVQHTHRLVDILRKIATYWRVNLTVLPADAERAKRFKKEMQLVDGKKCGWTLAEDPRTGLRIINIPQEFAVAFAPIAPKILHWFGSVVQPVKSWRGSKKERRCAWVTATCLFIAKPEGPGSNGRGIKHCVAIQYMTELFVGPGGDLGIVAAAGPQQPPVFITFDSEKEKQAVLFTLQECHIYRNGGKLIKVTPVESVENKIKAGTWPRNSPPQLFLMRPWRELYEFLRGPSA